jgi:hypothetical protein
MLPAALAVFVAIGGARLNDVLGQEPGGEFGGGFPDAGIQSGIEAGELRPQPHQTDPAIYL